MLRERYSSNTPWEETYKYSRAYRVGNLIYVSGTMASDEGKLVGAGDAYAQAKYIFAKIEKALDALGAKMTSVVRVRAYLVDIRDIDAVGRAHAETFADIRPANTTLQVAALAGEGYLVEIEAEAVVL